MCNCLIFKCAEISYYYWNLKSWFVYLILWNLTPFETWLFWNGFWFLFQYSYFLEDPLQKDRKNHIPRECKDTYGLKAIQNNTAIAFRKINCTGECAFCTPRSIGDETERDLDDTYVLDPGTSSSTEVRVIKPGMNVLKVFSLKILNATCTNCSFFIKVSTRFTKKNLQTIVLDS